MKFLQSRPCKGDTRFRICQQAWSLTNTIVTYLTVLRRQVVASDVLYDGVFVGLRLQPLSPCRHLGNHGDGYSCTHCNQHDTTYNERGKKDNNNLRVTHLVIHGCFTPMLFLWSFMKYLQFRPPPWMTLECRGWQNHKVSRKNNVCHHCIIDSHTPSTHWSGWRSLPCGREGGGGGRVAPN